LEGKEIPCNFEVATSTLRISPVLTLTNLIFRYVILQLQILYFFQSIFSKFGEIGNSIIMRDEKNTSRGFGFVSFKNLEDTERALEAFKVDDPNGLYVREALSKEQRQ
jgi:hypothetical protein